MVEEVETLEEEIRRLREEKEKRKPSIIGSIPSGKRMWGVIIAAGIAWYGYSHQWNIRMIGFMMGVIAIGIYITSAESESPKKRVLTRDECRAKLMEYIRRERMRPIGDLPMIHPNSKVKLGWPGKLVYRAGKPMLRTCKLSVINPRTHQEIVFQVNLEAFEGEIIAIVEKPEGMSGEEQRDVELVASPDLSAEKRYYKYGGKRWSPKG